ncbi:MAG: thioredoxin family protein [Myxococcota bacterium]
MRSASWLACAVLIGCSGKASAPEESAPVAAAKPTESKPRFVPTLDAGDVADEVRGVVESSGEETVVVYVGASWCGPCQAFHAALERGDLDERLMGVKFLEYDADRDTARLNAAGYTGRLIPRFALPGADGRFSGTKIEGGIKGDGAVEHILERLEPMIAGAS